MSVRMTDLQASIEKVGEAYDRFTASWEQRQRDLEAENAGLRERVEDLEARASTPGKPGDGKTAPIGYKVHHTRNGPIYELPANVKMADVIRPEKAPPVSFQRWLGAAVAGEKCQDAPALQFAREQKQLVSTTTGILIPEVYQSEWIDLIRSQMVLNAAGMTTLTMDAKTVNASAVTSDPAATWHSEAGSISAANPTFAARALTAQTLVTRCTASLEVSQDSPDFGAQLAGVMARAMAVELDRVGLIGTGTPPEPQGILGADNVNQVIGVGAIADYSDLIAGVGLLLQANIPLDVATANAIMSPAVWSKFELLATGISSDKSQLVRPKSLENTRFLVTSNGLDSGSPATSTIFLGKFDDLVLGVRREASVEVLKLSTYATNLQLEFVGYLRADYMIRRPASFCTLEGVAAE